MSKILVFGHQNPDSDAIGSSVAFAYLAKEAYGLDTEAVALGTPNEETAFVLKDRKSTRLNSSHQDVSRMPSSA